MAYLTVEQIIQNAIFNALRVRENQTDDQIHAAVNFYNQSEPFIWRKWPWKNRKIDEFSVTPDSEGIVTFDGDNSDVDIICGIKQADPNDESGIILVWAEDEILAAINGMDIGGSKFQHLSDDDNGNRRIKINVEDEVTTYKVLAKRRFVHAIVDPAYDSQNPSATPTDYRVLTWKIDRANQPLIEYVADQMREWSTQDKTGTWAHSVNAVVKDIREQEATDNTLQPDYGSFSGLGDLTRW
jgi:hypothetical protein